MQTFPLLCFLNAKWHWNPSQGLTDIFCLRGTAGVLRGRQVSPSRRQGAEASHRSMPWSMKQAVSVEVKGFIDVFKLCTFSTDHIKEFVGEV